MNHITKSFDGNGNVTELRYENCKNYDEKIEIFEIRHYLTTEELETIKKTSIKPKKSWGVNWSAYGTVKPEEAKDFVILLIEAIKDAEKNNTIQECPSCKTNQNMVRSALSRRVQGLNICSDCGTREALEDFAHN